MVFPGLSAAPLLIVQKKKSAERVSSGYSASTSMAISTHLIGDLIVVVGGGTNDAIVNVPAGWTEVARATGILNRQVVAAYKIAGTTSENSGTWGNVFNLACAVYRGSGGIGSRASRDGPASGYSPTFTFPSLSMLDSSIVLGCYYANMISSAPGMEVIGGGMLADTPDPVSAFPSTVGTLISDNGDFALSLEILGS